MNTLDKPFTLYGFIKTAHLLEPQYSQLDDNFVYSIELYLEEPYLEQELQMLFDLNRTQAPTSRGDWNPSPGSGTVVLKSLIKPRVQRGDTILEGDELPTHTFVSVDARAMRQELNSADFNTLVLISVNSVFAAEEEKEEDMADHPIYGALKF